MAVGVNDGLEAVAVPPLPVSVTGEPSLVPDVVQAVAVVNGPHT